MGVISRLPPYSVSITSIFHASFENCTESLLSLTRILRIKVEGHVVNFN